MVCNKLVLIAATIWFHDLQGEVQYFIGVQLDGSEHVDSARNCIQETAAKEGVIVVCDILL